MAIKNRYWSRNVGEYVNEDTGEKIESLDLMIDMSIQQWYETLALEIAVHLGLYTILTSRDVQTILENSFYYRPILKKELPEDVFLGPAVQVGELHGKEVWIDEQMDCNIIHLFQDKETFNTDRVSVHVVGLSVY